MTFADMLLIVGAAISLVGIMVGVIAVFIVLTERRNRRWHS